MGITLDSIKNKMLNKRFGKLTILKYFGKSERGDNLWQCRCDCGDTVIGRAASVDKDTSACSKCKRQSGERVNTLHTRLLGQTFGRLTVLAFDGVNEYKAGMWKCECACGKKVSVKTHSLVSGVSRSCGCLARERASTRNKTHGYSKHPLYAVYWAMKERCYNPKCKDYQNYGARGIGICKDWLDDFMIFFKWSMDNWYRRGLTIERKDNNGNYEPNNCRWTTSHEQAQNTRRTRLSTEQVDAIRQDHRPNHIVAHEYGVDASTISRVKANITWSNIG